MSFDSFKLIVGVLTICSSHRKSKGMMFFFVFFFIFILECGGIIGVGSLVFFYFMHFVLSISPSDKICFLGEVVTIFGLSSV